MGAQGRLTKYQIEAIVKDAVSDAVADEELALKKEENICIDALVEFRCKQAEVAAARRLPAKWIDTASRVTVSVRGQYVELNIKTYTGQTHHPLLPNYITFGIVSIGDGSVGLDGRLFSLYERRLALAARRTGLEAKVKALVESASTIKKLSEIWPDGEAYWGDTYRNWKARAQLPAVNVDEVNNLLGIPKEEAGAAS